MSRQVGMMDRIDDNRLESRWRDPILWCWVGAGLLLGLVLGGFTQSRDALPETPFETIAESSTHFERALRDPDALRRAGRIAHLLELVPTPTRRAEQSVAALRHVFERSPVQDGDVEFAMFGAWWARSDPAAAYQWLRVAPQASSISVLVAVLEEWGRSSPVAAIAAARLDRIDVRRAHGLEACLIGAGSVPRWSDQLGAIASEIPDRAERRAAIEGLAVRRLEGNDAARLLDWAQGMPAPDVAAHEDFVAGVALAVAGQDLPRAIAALEGLSLFPSTNASTGVTDVVSAPPADIVDRIAAQWAASDPAATLNWLAGLVPGEIADEAVQTAVRETYQKWVGRERSVALAWAAERDAVTEAWFDPVRATYGFIIGHEDPEEGLRVLFKLPIARERALKVQKIFAKWKHEAPEPAEAWLRRADLPEERKQELGALRVRSSIPMGVQKS